MDVEGLTEYIDDQTADIDRLVHAMDVTERIPVSAVLRAGMCQQAIIEAFETMRVRGHVTIESAAGDVPFHFAINTDKTRSEERD